MGELGLLGVPWSEALGGAGFDYIELHPHDPRDGEGRRLTRDHDFGAHDPRNVPDRPLRHRRPEEALRAIARQWSSPRRVRAHRAERPGATPRERGRRPRGETGTTSSTDRRSSSRTAAWARSSSSPPSPIPRKARRASAPSSSRRRRAIWTRRGSWASGTIASLPDMTGFRAGKKEDKLGWRASDTRSLIFEDVEVPAENRSARKGRGSSTSCGRSIPAASGLPRSRWESPKAPSRRRSGTRAFGSQFGKRIFDFQGVQFQLSDMATEIEAAKHSCITPRGWRSTGSRSARRRRWRSCSARSSPCARPSRRSRSMAGYGYTKEYPVERMMRDAKICEIGEGTSEIQRIVIARHLLQELAD